MHPFKQSDVPLKLSVSPPRTRCTPDRPRPALVCCPSTPSELWPILLVISIFLAFLWHRAARKCFASVSYDIRGRN